MAKRSEISFRRIFRTRVVLTALPLSVLLIAYARYVLVTPPETVAGLIAATVTVFLFALVGIRFVPDLLSAWTDGEEYPIRRLEGRRSGRRSRLHPFFGLMLLLIVWRLILFAFAYGIDCAGNGYRGGIFDSMGLWNQIGSDSRHYLSIAENGYVNTGDDRLLIVFFPFYPLVVRAANYFFDSYLTSGLFVSNVCALFAGYVFYELCLIDYDRRTSLRMLKFLCILPAAFLLGAPLSDSVFLLLSLLCVYCVRRERYLIGCFVGGLAAFTRAPGLLLTVPVVTELVMRAVREKKVGRTVGRALCVLLIPMGFVAYLAVNYGVTGNPFMFLVYQKSHWHQQLGWFFASAATEADYLVSSIGADRELLYGLWVPNLVSMVLGLAVLVVSGRKLRASNTAYFLVYYAVTMGATWLLSAPRYLVCCYPIAMGLGLITKRRSVNLIVTLLLLAGTAAYLYAYVNGWYVY